MTMTYRKLRDILNTMDADTLDQNVTIYVSGSDEFQPVDSWDRANSAFQDVLADGHMYLATRDYSMRDDDEHGMDYMENRFADSEALASAGFGTDEDYGYYGDFD